MTAPPARHAALPVAVTALAAIIALFGFIPGPAEDPIILFRYSENLANYGVITYNPGDTSPAEGATDFLWMLLLAGFHALGIPTFFAARALSLASLAGIGWVLRAWLPPSPRRTVIACALVGVLLLIPPLWAAASGFSAYFFAFWLLLAAHGFLRGRPRLMILAGCIACLTRPDGGVFILPLIAGSMLLNPAPWRQPAALAALLAAASAGIAYFLWRWQYFGLWLPLPFYVKSDIARAFGVFNPAALAMTAMILAPGFFPGAYIMSAIRKAPPARRRQLLVLAVAFILIPALFYATMDLTQNIAFRYHFPILLTLLALAAALYDPASAKSFWIYAGLWVALQLPLYGFYLRSNMPLPSLIAIAGAMKALPYKGTIATGEAGTLPYYSGWTVYDTLGLNTPQVALHELQPGDVARLKPDLIYIFHAHGLRPVSSPPGRFDRMIEKMLADADARYYERYRLHRVFYLWIRYDSPVYEALRGILLKHGAQPG